MIQKICPYCKLDSYSAYNDPHWLCPYCGRDIGHSRLRELGDQGQIKDLLQAKQAVNPLLKSKTSHLRVVR